jgi:hypothetical protein
MKAEPSVISMPQLGVNEDAKQRPLCPSAAAPLGKLAARADAATQTRGGRDEERAVQ